MEAQRYPDDFDGIIAGAPANDWEHLLASTIWIRQATHLTPASYLPNEKLAILHQAAVVACDASDGIKDGVIRDTLSCHFDPAMTQCKGADTSACLSPEQVDAARKIYSGPVNPRTHEKIFPGLEPGSEITWDAFAAPRFPIGASHFRYIVFKDPKWDPSTLNFDTDIAIAEKVDNGTLTATNPNPPALLRPRRQTHPLSRPLRRAHRTAEHYQLLQRRPRGQRPSGSRLHATLSSPRHGALLRRRRAPTYSISTNLSPPGLKTIRLPARSSPSTTPQTLHPPSPTAPAPSAPTPRLQSSKAAEAPTTPVASPAQSREFYLSPLLAHGAVWVSGWSPTLLVPIDNGRVAGEPDGTPEFTFHALDSHLGDLA
jgi:Tannase and feruloyl esterase